MSEIVYLPKWGMTMTEALIVNWLKSEGDSIEEGEELAEVETDKATSIVISPCTGILTSIVAAEGETVDVGAEIARITLKSEA